MAAPGTHPCSSIHEEFLVMVLGPMENEFFRKPEKSWKNPTYFVVQNTVSHGSSCSCWLSCLGVRNVSFTEVEGYRKLQSYMFPRLKRTILRDLSLFLAPSLMRDFLAIYSQSPNSVGVLPQSGPGGGVRQVAACSSPACP